MKLFKGLSFTIALLLSVFALPHKSYAHGFMLSNLVLTATVSSNSNYEIYPHQYNSASCKKAEEWKFSVHDILNYDWLENAMLMTNGECYINGLTTNDAAIDGMLQDIYEPAMDQFSLIRQNFQEINTQIVNNIAYESDGKISKIDTTIVGDIVISIDGVVNSNGDVPVKIHGFDAVTVGKITKKILFSNVHIYPKITYASVNLKGRYNIHNRTLNIDSNLSNFRPDVAVDVDIPSFLDLLDRLTPKIFETLQREFGRIVIDVFKFVGVDVINKAPQAVQHNVTVSNSSIVPITQLDSYQSGDRVKMDIILSWGQVRLVDAQSDIALRIWLTYIF
ncbi:hypothetical protein [Pseudoalteromonas aurantia]|uniref:Uncharacterized protein n=1 Tax=Pseudoalteromonas aurantia 208 TaxID=1314867 RepID=A0ABR9EBG8_9GAMM|nr:hypothetical protein [Pseudoalteromonas aurantia]MBE0368305.1 hypothetical protein [Pseudoalteromonas aurantia 208]